jgi:aldehyde dehydrogenase (NAD+)
MLEMLAVRNPRTGRADDPIPIIPSAELRETGERLRDAQPAWEAMGVQRRADALGDFAAALERDRDAVIAALVADTGRHTESVLEVDAVLASLERWRQLAVELLDEEAPRLTALPTIAVRQGWQAYPLVGVISPWNFPLLLGLIDAIPALLAGSAVMVKPSEITPRFVAPLQRLVPPSVPLTVVVGGPETGAKLIDCVDAVCFTGSVPTGHAVAAAAAARLIPAYLELGGKDPAIVMASADIDHAAAALLWGSTANAGQSCLSIERIYVDRAVFEPFVERLVANARDVPLAYPEPTDGVIGPIIAERQIGVIADHLEDAGRKGAVTHCGGALEQLGGGTYVRPSVLTRVDHTMRVMTRETFGPLMPVMPFASTDEAVALANSTQYGLSGAVFAGSDAEALAVARRVEAGAISINDAALTAVMHEGEKQAFRHSGLGGSRMGPASLRRFLRRRAYLVKSGTAPDPWWY